MDSCKKRKVVVWMKEHESRRRWLYAKVPEREVAEATAGRDITQSASVESRSLYRPLGRLFNPPVRDLIGLQRTRRGSDWDTATLSTVASTTSVTLVHIASTLLSVCYARLREPRHYHCNGDRHANTHAFDHRYAELRSLGPRKCCCPTYGPGPLNTELRFGRRKCICVIYDAKH